MSLWREENIKNEGVHLLTGQVSQEPGMNPVNAPLLLMKAHFWGLNKLFWTKTLWFLLQNKLLEVGWNKSESTQKDVEKTLNCCGFSSVDLNQTCSAVSGFSSISRSTVGSFSLKSLSSIAAMLLHPLLLLPLRQHPADVRRGRASLCGRRRPLLQLHGGQWSPRQHPLFRVSSAFRGRVSAGFFQILGVWLTHRYRNLKDPRSNPGAFL